MLGWSRRADSREQSTSVTKYRPRQATSMRNSTKNTSSFKTKANDITKYIRYSWLKASETWLSIAFSFLGWMGDSSKAAKRLHLHQDEVQL